MWDAAQLTESMSYGARSERYTPCMRERKPYPDLSDEELDRRAEEALKRMLNAPPKPPQNQQRPPRRNRPKRRPR